jgi:hypothetical protein
MSRRTWEDNAKEFGALSRQGKDMRLAVLVACSVEKGAGQGARQPLSDRKEVRGKASAAEFGRVGTTTAQRVLRHLTAWNKLAREGLVKAAAELKPNDATTIEVSDEAIERFDEVFDATDSGGRPRASVEEISRAIVTNPEYAKKLAPAIAKAMETPEVTQEITTQASQQALGNVDTAASTESYLRRRKAAAEHEPPEDAASRQLGGVGPAALADKLHKETMEPRLDRIISAFDFAAIHWGQYGFRLALTDVDEFDELDERLARVGKLYAELMDLYDAAKAAKIANEAEGARQ